MLIFILLAAIAFIVLATSVTKLHPFLALLIACYGIGLATGLPLTDIDSIIAGGFGKILGSIGLIILLGTIIGTILEKSGAAFTMADTVVKMVGDKRPELAMGLIGSMVSIPVFCDSGFVILSSLRRSLAKRCSVSPHGLTVSLACGLYATHTLVPPTPGPIAAAANLGIDGQLGLIILMGLGIAIVPVTIGILWGRVIGLTTTAPVEDLSDETLHIEETTNSVRPSVLAAFAPILIPILLIALGSIANLTVNPFADGAVTETIRFIGKPLNALCIGLACCLPLLSGTRITALSDLSSSGITAAASIIVITGAGGALGAMLKATGIGDELGKILGDMNLGIFLPFIIAAALKTAQGSSTVALVTTSALIAPMLASLGLNSDIGTILAVMATGAGAMTISHANDSYFWVVSQFGGMDVATAYRTHSLGTLFQGIGTMTAIFILSLILL